MTKLFEGWKGMRKSAQILLVISMIVGVVFGISFFLTITTSGETSWSAGRVKMVNNIFAGSMVAALLCFVGFLADTRYKHNSKT